MSALVHLEYSGMHNGTHYEGVWFLEPNSGSLCIVYMNDAFWVVEDTNYDEFSKDYAEDTGPCATLDEAVEQLRACIVLKRMGSMETKK